MDAFGQLLETYWGSLLVGASRWYGMSLLIPFLKPPLLPGMIRSSFLFLMALIVLPTIHEQWLVEDWTGWSLTLVILKEFIVGVMLGLPVSLMFTISKSVGDFIDNQRGASIASVFNPSAGEQSSLYAVILEQAFVVFFLSSVGFSGLCAFVLSSYTIFPIGLPEHSPLDLVNFNVLVDFLLIYLDSFVVLSAPVIAAMLLAEIGLGLIGRFVPQLNVFFISMPLKSLIAIIILIAIFVIITTNNNSITLSGILHAYSLYSPSR